MAENYRVRVKRGDTEIEVESTDKDYVESKVKEFVEGSGKVPEIIFKSKPMGHTHTLKKTRHSDNGDKDNGQSLDVAGLVEFIKDSDDYPKVEKNILDKKQSTLGRIMLCMHFSNQFAGNPYVTTGQIQHITDQLGVKIPMAQASNKITSNQVFFSAKVRRAIGRSVPYKLTRPGEAEFAKILNGTIGE